MAQGETGIIVGRSGSLAAVGSAMIGRHPGDRSTVLISGEAGIGKTSLLRAAVGALPAGKAVVGWGTCWHGDGAPAFWPWMRAFGDIARQVGPEPAAAAAGADIELLRVLVRELGPAGEVPVDRDTRRLLLLEAAVRWMENLAGRRRVVVVLDDLQWADPSTLDLLDYAAGVHRPVGLTIVGSHRHDDGDPEVMERLASLGARVEHIHLSGLSVAETEELLATVIEADQARRMAGDLHRRTGGHPLFTKELARLTAADGDELPTVVTAAVARRLDLMPEDTRVALEVAAVAGNRILTDVVGDVLDRTPALVAADLGPAVDAGLVRATRDGEYRFTHDLFREVLYQEIGATGRRARHGSVGEALGARVERGFPVVPGDIAEHLVRGLSGDSAPGALFWARRAARDERSRSAFREAADHLRRLRHAVAAAGLDLDPVDHVEVLLEEADSRARSGDPVEARTLLAEADRRAPDPTWRAEVALAVQRLGARFAAPRDHVISQLESALAGIEGQDPRTEARLAAALARELRHSVAEDRARAGPLSEEALVLGRRSGDDTTLLECLLARHDALWRPGTGGRRAELGREIAEVGSRLGDTDRFAEGLLLEANGLLEEGSPLFRTPLERWLSVLGGRDEPHDRYMIETRRAALALLEGDTGRAEELMWSAADLGEAIHEPDTGNVLMSQRVALARARRDPGELVVLARDAIAWWTGAPLLAHSVAAGALAEAGDLEGAAREMRLVSGEGGWRAEDSYLASVLVSHLAEAAVALEDVDLAGSLLEMIEPLVGSCGVNGAVVAFAGPFAHPAGLLARVLGDRDRARSWLERSAGMAADLGSTPWLERSRRSLAELEAEIGGGTDASPGGAANIDIAHFVRRGRVWSIAWGGEEATLPHVKGLGDLAELLRNPGREIPALQLAGGLSAGDVGGIELADPRALAAYRDRLDELDSELDRAGSDADLARLDRLVNEREQLLAELRRVTGLGGRPRSEAAVPAERARKAVSARIRDAIGRLSEVAPVIAAHLDRSVRTGIRCAYRPDPGDGPDAWQVEVGGPEGRSR